MSNLGKRLLDSAAKILVGTEKLAPEVAQKIEKVVASSGRINEKALGSRRFGGNLLLGHKGAVGAIKGRYAQGGILGPGGVLLGELALDPRFKSLVKELKASTPGSTVLDPYTGSAISRRRALAKTIGKGATESINPAFLVGLPLVESVSALGQPDYLEEGGMSGVLGSLGNAAGFMATAPLGLVGGIGGSIVGDHLGHLLGGALDPSEPLLPLGGSSEGFKVPSASNLILDAAAKR
jgi:hypothetical protein